jgi:hypothetical protein
MTGKAARSPAYWRYAGTENAASVYLRGPAETWSSVERFRGVRTSGTAPTQRAADTGHEL